MSGLAEQILDSQQIMIESSIKKAGYDKTIQAQIVSCVDQTIGKYKCSYQDALFYAYTNNSDISFSNGSHVYILVPGNDMRREKTILGTTSKLGINYISQAQGDQAYDIIGNNCITVNDTFYLNTENENYVYKIYEYKKSQQDSQQEIFDIDSLNQYIKQSSSLIVGATFKTSIKAQNQYRGHYGITYTLRFVDNTSNEEALRSYTVNEDNMIDNPYRLIYPTRQYQIFDIDGPNFIRVESIQIFNKQFPVTKKDGGVSGERLYEGDIEITKLEISGAVRMSQSEINGVAITFYTPQGTFFTEGSNLNSTKTITAQVRVKGKLASAAQNIPFYWGIQNMSVSPKSQHYNKYLGRGWKCLNNSNIVNYKMELINPAFLNQIIKNGQEEEYYFKNSKVYTFNESEDKYELATKEDLEKKEKSFYYSKPDVIEWIPLGDTYIFNFANATARDNKLKVAIVYDGNVVSKQINIQNFANPPILTIESSGGTQFYYDIGHPTLICKVQEKENNSNKYIQQPSENFRFSWAYQDNEGVLQQLPETKDDYVQYTTKRYDRDKLLYLIELGVKSGQLQQEKDKLNDLNKRIDQLERQQKVYENIICDVQINQITKFGIFKCSVQRKVPAKDENDVTITDEEGNPVFDYVYLGTCSITLKNTLDGENLYSLVINNGSSVFQYNENGVAPNNKSLDVQQQLQALTFTVYDNLGQPIDNNIILNDDKCKIRWQFPVKDTLLIDKSENGKGNGFDPTLTYKYYDDTLNLMYDIATNYDIRRQRNQIKLTVDYKGMNLTTETNFTFAKQGEPGTNGTEYVVKLVPNAVDGTEVPLWPMVTTVQKNNNSYSYLLNYKLSGDNKEISTNKGYKLLKAQLWHNGEKVWEGTEIENDPNKRQPLMINWEVLSNNYNKNITDDSAFKVEDKATGKIRFKGNQLDKKIIDPYANIIKCSITWQDDSIDEGQSKTYYGTIPITTAWVSEEKYRVSLKDYTGWRYAIYTSDGVLPQYDNSHPFEFIIQEKMGDTWVDVSLAKNSTEDQVKQIEDDKTITNEEIKKIVYEQMSNKVTYAVAAVGNTKSTQSGGTIPSNLIKITQHRQGDSYEINQWAATPAPRYDGLCVNAAITCEYKIGNGTVGRINVPIHFLLNKFGLSHINAWDGNSVQVDSDGGFILAPQMGSGIKNSSNEFTGVLMGEVKNAGKSKADVGLLGYDNGERTFFLNSVNGSALFGKEKKSQIVIDPRANNAYIYSGNFWKEDHFDPETGLPKSYDYKNSYNKPNDNCNKQGMIIDLTTPEIYFGTGNFYVTADGYIHAASGGDIGGWKIGTEEITDSKGNKSIHSILYSNIAKNSGRITLDAGILNTTTGVVTGPGKIYSHQHDELNKYGNGFYLSCNGLSIGSKAKLKDDGTMYIGTNASANGGEPDPDSKHPLSRKYWTIDGNSSNSYIAYNGTSFYKADKDDSDYEKNEDKKKQKESPTSVYIGTNGISLGEKFSVNNQGQLIANSGKIGGWSLSKNTITAGNIQLNSEGSIKGGDNKNGKDYKWQIAKNGQANFNYITAQTGGKIAGWTISSDKLTGGSMTLNSDGSIHGDGWYINAGGDSAGIKGTLPLNSDGYIDISGALRAAGGYIGSAGGHLGASGVGLSGASTTAPLCWDSTGVKLQKGAEIGTLSIKADGTLSNSGNGGSINISKNSIYATYVRGQFQYLTPGTQGDYTTLHFEKSKSGTAKFSDGGWLKFEHGILIDYEAKSDGGLVSFD